jgi:serine/threonine-protein kinase HipA
MEKFFTLVVFNYLFSNGDAHLKNFSLQETDAGDYVLTPAYDLMNTSIHVNDGDFALQNGLMHESAYSEVYSQTLHPCKDDFITFGTRIGVLPKKLNAIIELFATEQPKVYELIENSFLEEKVKRMYKQSYQERLHRFQRSDRI